MSDIESPSPGSWDYECPRCGFTSRQWPTKAIAKARAAQHTAEHDGGPITASLDDFRAQHGLNPDGSVA